MFGFSLDLGNLITHLRLDTTQFDSSFAMTQAKLKTQAQHLEKIGRTLITRVSAPLLLIGGYAAKTAISMESAFAGVRKTVDATQAEFAALEQGFKEMSTRIPLSVESLMGVGEAAGQLGIAKENILDFSEVMSKLGVTTNMTSEEASMSLARFANITQMSAKDFGRLGATIVDLGNNLATTEGDIVAMSMRVASAGRIAGLAEPEILAISGALSSVGVEAQVGGTAIQKVLINMTRAVADGNKQLKVFAQTASMSAKDFVKLWKEDAAEAFTRFIEGLGKSGDSAFKVLEKLELSDQRVIRSILSIAKAGGLLRESMTLGNKAWEENIALNEEAAKRFETSASRLRLVWNEARLAAESFRDDLLPATLSFLEGYVKPFLTYIRQMDPATKRFIADIAFLAIVAGPAAWAISKVTLALIAMNTAMGQSVLALGMLKTYFAAALVWIVSFRLGSYLFEEFKSIQKFGIETAGFLLIMWEKVKFGFQLMVTSGIKKPFNIFYAWFLGRLSNLLLRVSSFVGKMEEGLAKLKGVDVSDVDLGYNSLMQAMLDLRAKASDTWDGIGEDVKEARRLHEEEIAKIREALITELGDIDAKFAAKDKLSALDKIIGTGDADKIKKLLAEIEDQVGDLGASGSMTTMQDMLDALDQEKEIIGLINEGYERGADIIAFKNAAIQEFDSNMDLVNAAVDKYKAKLEELRHAERMNVFARWMNDAKDLWGSLAQDATAALDDLASSLTEFITKGDTDWRAFTKRMLNSFMESLVKMQMAMAYQQWLKPLLSAVGNAIMPGMGTAATSVPAGAKGLAFSQGSIVPMATGHIISAATLIPYNRRKTALIGEAGPEAVMPLSRDSTGRLGVKADQPRVNVNNMTKIVNVFDREEQIAAMKSDPGEKVILNVLRKKGLI